MAVRQPSCSHIFSIGTLTILLLLSFHGSNLTLSVVHSKNNTYHTEKPEENQSMPARVPPSYRPHCESFNSQEVDLYAESVPDVVSYVSDITRDDRERILAGDFPSTRFTPHIESILKLMDLENMEDKCKWNFYFTVDKPYSKPSRIFCTGMKRSRQVPWWCKIFHQLFEEESTNHAFPPILPANASLAMSTDDFNDVMEEGYTCLANSSPRGAYTITTFLELQRMADHTTYPMLNWTKRCKIPIWRGSAWREPGRISTEDESLVLEQLLQKSTRMQAVLFSKEHSKLLDARISDPQNGFMTEKKLWVRNATNGLDKLLPIHDILSREYYTQYQTALVLCGRGAAFRTPIHLSTATAVVLQSCPYEEWYHSYMVPWEHYIPLDQDLRNLTLTVKWIRDHPKEVYSIATKGRQFYEEYMSFERNYDHFYELLYRLALLTSRNNITFQPPMHERQ
jgi:hypothetical protein